MNCSLQETFATFTATATTMSATIYHIIILYK